MTAMIAAVPASGSDADAIAASLTDPRAFAAVFDRHFDAIHAYLRARLGTFLADDLAAETFIRAFDARRRFDLRHADSRPWLFAIATNLAREHHRAEGRRMRALCRLDPRASTPANEDATIARLDAAAVGRDLAAALDSLRPDDRDALLLVAWAELTYEEAARAVDVPVGTIRSRVHRARAAVRGALEPQRTQEAHDG
jgi:RNA polymerase sigma-70 factor (ECF subfamily)